MVLSCLGRPRLPGLSPHLSFSDSVVPTPYSKSPGVFSVETAQSNSQATGATAAVVDGKVCQTPLAALHCKFSSSFHGSRAPKELTSSSSAKSAWRDGCSQQLPAFPKSMALRLSKEQGNCPRISRLGGGTRLSMRRRSVSPFCMTKGILHSRFTLQGAESVAIGDVHGDLARTEWALQLAGVLSSDGQGRWIGGNTVLIQVGDILDRGEDEIAILSLLHNLSQQAQRRGGAVFQVNGNHETMNVEGDFRFVVRGGFEEAENFTDYCEEVHDGDYEAAFSGWYLASKKRKASRPFLVELILNPMKMLQRGAAARAFLFSPGGPIARKLSQHGVVLKVNGWLFAHGGVLPHHVKYGLEKLNNEVAQWMRGDQGDHRHSRLPPFMAIWFVRPFEDTDLGNSWDPLSHGVALVLLSEKACAVLEATLEAVGAKALVVGHTPQPFGANCECKGQVWRIDVGMSSGVNNAEPGLGNQWQQCTCANWKKLGPRERKLLEVYRHSILGQSLLWPTSGIPLEPFVLQLVVVGLRRPPSTHFSRKLGISSTE